MEKSRSKSTIINIALLAVFLFFIIFATVKYAPDITRFIGNPEQFRDLLVSYGALSVLVFIFFQVVQVIIAAIPGEVIQIAGGYVFGTLLGTLYSTIGILAGSIIVFYISRFLGFSLVKTFVSPKKLEKFNFLINNQKSEIAIFFLFLIPGLPKDVLTYIAGLTPVKPLRFFVTVMIARFPGLIASSYIGANLQKKDYLPVIVVSIIACVLFTAGVLLKDRIIEKISVILNMRKSAGSK